MTASIDLEEFDGSAAQWDQALARLEGRTFCHQAGWSAVFERSFGHEPIRLAARDPDGTVIGLLPIVRMRSRIFGHNLVSMPFLNYGGPVGSLDARVALTERAVEIARDSDARLLELRSISDADLGLPQSAEKVTVLLPLPNDAQELWEHGLKAKVRSQVRRPSKAGMETAVGVEHISAFYEVFSRNMRDLGTPVLPKRLFEATIDAFADQMITSVVYKGAEPTAGGVGFLYDDEFELTWASSSREHARDAPNMLLYWSLMEEVIRRGARVFNFGRCSPGSGTHRFKLQWGGVDEPLHWSRWSPSGDAATPSKDARSMRAAIAVWQRLPLPIANRLGPIVSRALPTW